MGYKPYSDSHLMSLTKAQIIELLRVAEHNFFATEEALNNSTKAGMEIAEKFDEAKRLLKMAVEDINFNTVCLNCDTCKVCAKRYGISGTSCEEKFKWYYTDEALKLIESGFYKHEIMPPEEQELQDTMDKLLMRYALSAKYLNGRLNLLLKRR